MTVGRVVSWYGAGLAPGRWLIELAAWRAHRLEFQLTDLLITRVSPGVSLAKSVGFFDSLEIYRIERSSWKETPQSGGVYLLYGQSKAGKLTAYIGKSDVNMLNRLRSHHVKPKKNWFGIIFAVPISNPLLCAAVEADLIDLVIAAGVVDVVDNISPEERFKGIDDPQVEPTVEKVREGLEVLLGSDIFTPPVEESTPIDAPVKRMEPLAREYLGQAAKARPPRDDDPTNATHSYVGAGLVAWGAFNGPEPDKKFRVFAGSRWRKPNLDLNATTFKLQKKVDELQASLVAEGILDDESLTFKQDYVFENWNYATQVVSGKGQYSGTKHWQPILVPES